MERSQEALNLKQLASDVPPGVISNLPALLQLGSFDEGSTASLLLASLPASLDGMGVVVDASSEPAIPRQPNHLEDSQGREDRLSWVTKAIALDLSQIDLTRAITQVYSDYGLTATPSSLPLQTRSQPRVTVSNNESNPFEVPPFPMLTTMTNQEQPPLPVFDMFANDHHDARDDVDDDFGDGNGFDFNEHPLPEDRPLSSVLEQEVEAEGEDTQPSLMKDPFLAGRSWAGPEHWRIRRHAAFQRLLNNNREASSTTNNLAPTSAPAIKGSVGRPKKAPLVHDFARLTLDGEEDSIWISLGVDALLAKPANPNLITLGQGVVMERSLQMHCLPPDYQYNSARLLGLFCHPTWRRTPSRTKAIRTAKLAAKAHAQDPVNPTNNAVNYVEESFWGQDNDPGAPDHYNSGNVDDGGGFAEAAFDGTDHFIAAPGGFDEMDEAVPIIPGAAFQPSNPLLSILLGNNKKAAPSSSQLLLRAKRVDIQALKQDMKSFINSHTSNSSNSITMADLMVSLKPSKLNPDNVDGENKARLDDLSPQYCFITLLHVANENGWVLEGDGLSEDISIKPFLQQ